MRDVGIALTLINSRPYKFKITCDSEILYNENLLGKIPLVYYFEDLLMLRNIPPVNFKVMPVSLFLSLLETDNIQGINIDNMVVKLSLLEIKNNIDQHVINLLTTHYEEYLKLPIIEGNDLKIKILQFCYEIYKYKPQEKISVRDLWYNMKAEIDDISSWGATLVEKGFLVRISSPMVS